MANPAQINGRTTANIDEHGKQHRRKTPTVHEALPFTPFSSIIPFDAAVIPPPTCAEVSSINAAAIERNAAQNARTLLTQLSEGAERAENASHTCQKTISAVKKLIQTNATSHFTFRKPLHHILDISNGKQQRRPQLSAFAEAVLQSQPFPSVAKRSASFDNVQVRSKSSVAVSISRKLIPDQQAEYQSVPEAQLDRDPVVHASKRAVVDEKAKGDAAVRDLKTVLSEIFTAAKHEGTDDPIDPFAPSHFAQIDGEYGPVTTLASTTQAKVDAALRKVVVAGRIGEFPPDDFKQLQRFCEPNITRIPSLQMSSDTADDVVEDWQHRLMDADASMVAVRILLRTMTGTTRELRSESLVRSIVEGMKQVAESFVPVVEVRPKSNTDESTFSAALLCQKQLLVVLQDFGKALRLFIGLLDEVELDESAVSGIMYTCRAILFAENASSDKESVLGVQNFEALRRLAMDIVVKLFQLHADQRVYIINELINSLEKLPPSKQAARQYRLPDSKPIQLLSALFMQLIQSGAITTYSTATFDKDEEPETEDEPDSLERVTNALERSTQRLRTLISPTDSATKTYAHHIVNSLVQRASSISKNSDEPFRKLLDIFVEDFLSVLGLPTWPAAELLLQFLFRHLISILRDSKSTVLMKNFALDLIARLCAGILDLKANIRKHTTSAGEQNELPSVIRSALQGSDGAASALILDKEAYCSLLKSLHEQGDLSCRDYHKLRWSQLLLGVLEKDKANDTDDRLPPLEVKLVCDMLCQLFTDELWFDRHAAQHLYAGEFTTLSSMLFVSSADFARTLPSISVNLLHASMRSEHVTERSQALRSTSIIIDNDHTTLEQYPALLKSILNCMEDTSPLVRDAAMNLITKCMEQSTGLGARVYENISSRCVDNSANVRKRAMRVLKEIFIREESLIIRANIVQTIVGRIDDHEESVADVAQQILMDTLFTGVIEKRQHSASHDLHDLAQLLVQVVDMMDHGDDLEASLIKFIRHASKTQGPSLRRLVETLFDGVISPQEFSKCSETSQALLLRTIAVLIQSQAKLLEAKQLLTLEPYLKNLTDEDLPVFCMALAVLRYGISRTRGLPRDFLLDLQNVLIKSLGKLGETEVSAVAICLAAIDSELGAGNREKLAKVQLAALKALKASRAVVPVPDGSVRKIQRLLHMAGQFGQACDFEPQLETYRTALAEPRASSATSLSVEIFSHFASEQQNGAVRKSALSAICAVAQRSPRLFLTIAGRINQIISANDKPLIMVCLDGMLAFFQGQAKNAEGDDADATGRERLASTYVATDQDGAAAGLSERFLQSIKHLAFSSVDGLGLMATKLMASIVQQGLPHPKECGPTFVALETSSNDAIAQIAAVEHRMLHDKHETIIEKEYMRSMDTALRYQLDTIGDPSGCTGQPPVAKLHRFWAVLKAGKPKVRQKFIVNLCQRLSFDPANLHANHLFFARFTIENVACFDYDRIEDLKLLVEQLGTVFAAVGASVAQAIDTQVNNISIENLETAHITVQPPFHAQLPPLAASSQVLLVIAEARDHLVRVWGGKILARDKGATAKPPTKNANVAALIERFLARTAELVQPLDDASSQRDMCQRFVDVMNVDSEARVDSDDDADGSDDESQQRNRLSVGVTGTPSGRKRKSVDRQSGPKKRAREAARRSLSAVSKQTDEQESDADWP